MSDDDDHTLNPYDDSNRAFLQAFLARSTLTYKEARPILAAIFSAHEDKDVQAEDITDADINSYIARANKAISQFDFEIRSALPTNAARGAERIFALVNTTSDQLTQLATTYSGEEIAFLKRILDAMFETYNDPRKANGEVCAVTNMQAVRLCKPSTAESRRQSGGAAANGGEGATGQGLSMREAERALKAFVEDGWFEKTRAGFYNLSPRGLMELRSWLVATYNDPAGDDEEEDGARVDRIKFCYLCKEILISGQRCSTTTCTVRMHDLCSNTFFSSAASRGKTCPQCKATWTGNDYVGERAITTSDKYLQGRRRSGAASGVQPSSQRARSSRTEVEEASEEEEDEEEGSED